MTNDELFELYDKDLVLRLHNAKNLSDTYSDVSKCYRHTLLDASTHFFGLQISAYRGYEVLDSLRLLGSLVLTPAALHQWHPLLAAICWFRANHLP